MRYLNDNSFVAHQDDKRHVAWVVVVCLVGDATIRLSHSKDGEVVHRIKVNEGDVYALTGDSLRAMYHSVELDDSFTGSRVAWTLRVTNLDLRNQNDLPLPP